MKKDREDRKTLPNSNIASGSNSPGFAQSSRSGVQLSENSHSRFPSTVPFSRAKPLQSPMSPSESLSCTYSFAHSMSLLSLTSKKDQVPQLRESEESHSGLSAISRLYCKNCGKETPTELAFQSKSMWESISYFVSSMKCCESAGNKEPSLVYSCVKCRKIVAKLNLKC